MHGLKASLMSQKTKFLTNVTVPKLKNMCWFARNIGTQGISFFSPKSLINCRGILLCIFFAKDRRGLMIFEPISSVCQATLMTSFLPLLALEPEPSIFLQMEAIQLTDVLRQNERHGDCTMLPAIDRLAQGIWWVCLKLYCLYRLSLPQSLPPSDGLCFGGSKCTFGWMHWRSKKVYNNDWVGTALR